MVWIILSTEKIGGAEKRFVGIWESLMLNANLKTEVTLVLGQELFNIFSESLEFKKTIAKFEKYVLIENVLSKFGLSNYRDNINEFVKSKTKNGDTLHFVDGHPLKNFKNRKVIFSITQSSLKNLSLKGNIAQLLGTLLSSKIDVLDPKIFLFIKKYFFYKKKQIFNTPGSFCNTDLFYPEKWEQKKDWIVFLGRFEPVKQIINYIKAIPTIYQSLKNKGFEYSFLLIGTGSLSEEINTILSGNEYNSLPVIVEYREDVNEVLNKAKYFVSLQLHNNYPSRSLIEAMASGAIPIVTDVGETGDLVKNEFGYFVPENFTTSDLKNTFEIAISSSNEDQVQKSSEARNHILANFSANKSLDYFLELYKS